MIMVLKGCKGVYFRGGVFVSDHAVFLTVPILFVIVDNLTIPFSKKNCFG